MRLLTRLFAALLACGLLLGCHSSGATSAVTSGKSPDSLRQELATLAFLAYLGDAVTGSDENVENQLDDCMVEALQTQPGVQRWDLAWGPAVYHFSLSKLDDNMMYVVRDHQDPSHLAVVVRGTNPKAILDWLVEDFDVVDQVGWPAGSGQPKISKAISEGLAILTTMTPEGGPDPGHTLQHFLEGEAKSHPDGLTLEFAGHSLGGALAPTLALWAHDTLDLGPSKIRVYSLAGPSAGNADFAAYYDSALPDTHRLWNPYDVVPRAWNHTTMGQMADLYEPATKADPVERGLIDGLRSLVADKGYSQIQATWGPLPGALTGTACKRMDWGAEAGWQHHWGYQCALGINVMTATQNCPSKPAPSGCPESYCPQTITAAK